MAESAGIDAALPRLDRDPADRDLPIYGDCGVADGAGDVEVRAWLLDTDDLGPHYAEIAADAKVSLAPVMSWSSTCTRAGSN